MKLTKLFILIILIITMPSQASHKEKSSSSSWRYVPALALGAGAAYQYYLYQRADRKARQIPHLKKINGHLDEMSKDHVVGTLKAGAKYLWISLAGGAAQFKSPFFVNAQNIESYLQTKTFRKDCGENFAASLSAHLNAMNAHFRTDNCQTLCPELAPRCPIVKEEVTKMRNKVCKPHTSYDDRKKKFTERKDRAKKIAIATGACAATAGIIALCTK